MLKVGTRAPDFEAVQHDGGTFRLSEHFGRQPVVLYFHTGAFSILWNIQSKGFRDADEAFQGYNALVAGISPNTPEVNAQFRSEFGMQAVLLSDPDRKIRKAYESLRVFGGFRTAYLIDKSGVVRGAHEYVVVGIGRHVKKLLKGLEKLREEELVGGLTS